MVSFTSRFPWISFQKARASSEQTAKAEPLREFVYLDEVSLASLLASQTGELTENVTAQSTEGLLNEVGGKIGTNTPLLPKAEASSRFQTSNSNSLQTVRKANAQSLFREFYKLEHLRFIQPTEHCRAANSVTELFSRDFDGSVYKATDLCRGDLVEFRVQLSASWIFQMSTMVAEFSDMFDESPTLFMEHVKFSDMYQAKNANKIVSRLLAGLVPVDGLVPDYSVVEHEGNEYIAHNSAISDLDLLTKPLLVVGVTEHLAYWKDIRRILFANNEFNMLCRISKTGIQHSWNPIKLADIFKQFAPDLAGQIEQSTRTAMAQSLQERTKEATAPNLVNFALALVKYRDLVLETIGRPISKQKLRQIDSLMADMKAYGGSAEGQRAAFARVKAMIREVTNRDIDAKADLAVRQQVRELFDLPLFPRISDKAERAPAVEPVILESQPSRFLDVEVVAIYW